MSLSLHSGDFVRAAKRRDLRGAAQPSFLILSNLRGHDSSDNEKDAWTIEAGWRSVDLAGRMARTRQTIEPTIMYPSLRPRLNHAVKLELEGSSASPGMMIAT